MKILIVDDEDDLREIITMVVESRLNLKTVTANCGKQAIELLALDPEISAVISDYNMPNGTGGDVFNYIQSSQKKVPFILCSSGLPTDFTEFRQVSFLGYVQKPFRCAELSGAIQKGLSLLDSSKEKNAKRYYPIKLKHLLRSSLLEFDCYIKISEEKYVKILNRGELFFKNDYQKYIQKGIDSFYLTGPDIQSFLEKYAREVTLLSQAKSLTLDKGYAELAKTFETVQTAVSNIGFSKEAVDLAKASATLAVAVLTQDVQYEDFAAQLKMSPKKYFSYHSILLAYISCLIASVTDLGGDIVQFKLALASLLHDVALTDPASAVIEMNLQSLGINSSWSQQAIDDFKSHPARAGEAISQLTGLPPGIDQIVSRHHEKPDGTGFPEQLKSQDLDLITSVFIMAHDLTNTLFLSTEKSNLINFVERNEALYSTHHFSAILNKLKESFQLGI
jgi:response regulator RpfG family c-di-GMP phosphodiesterase